MIYLLDTNICIYLIKKKSPTLLYKFRQLQIGDVGISTITLSELHFGVEKSQKRDSNLMALNQFLMPLEIVSFDVAASLQYGIIRSELERLGTPIGPMDTLIAAHALSLKLTLVTNNLSEFSRIKALQTENWV